MGYRIAGRTTDLLSKHWLASLTTRSAIRVRGGRDMTTAAGLERVA
jgi:hypothetical protein